MVLGPVRKEIVALLDLPGTVDADGPVSTATDLTADRVAGVSVVLLLGWCGSALVLRTGGREPHVLSVGLFLLLGALVAVRPWRLLPVVLYGGLCAVGAASFGVVLLAPTGWAGASEAASWTFASQVAAVVLAWATTELRRAGVLAGLAASSLLSFAAGWMAWWGGQNPAAPFLGTFYWHNQEGIYLAAGAVLGLLGVTVGPRAAAPLAWLTVALCGAGVLLTTSRASAMAMAVGGVLVAAVAMTRASRGPRSLVKVVAGALLVAGTGYLLTGPPFFPHRSSPLAGTAARSATGQSVAVNGGYRLDDWRNGVKVFLHWPLSGTGFHGFASASASLDHGQGSRTPFVHNGFLQLMSDGGLLLAVPVLALLGALLVTLLRGLRRLPPTGLAAAVVLVVLALHSAVDFDWSYPALLVSFAVVAAVCAAASGTRRQPAPRRGQALLAVFSLLLVGLACAAAWHGGLHLNVPIGGRS